MGAELKTGAFVWARFPFVESPREPGPETHLHAVYVIAVDERAQRAIVAYTTTGLRPQRMPEGFVVAGEREAGQMNQRPFALDAKRIGLLPIDETWFPGLRHQRPVLAMATPDFAARVMREIERMMVTRKIRYCGPWVGEDTSKPPRIG